MANLIRYEQAYNALQACATVDEVKDIRDKAEAMRAYAQQAKDDDMVRWAAEIKLRAERRAGEMLAAMAENGERDTGQGGDRKSHYHDDRVKLEDIGVSYNESSRWQKEATLPEDEFEKIIATTPGPRLTQTAILRAVEKRRNADLREDNPTPAVQEKYDVIVIDPPWPMQRFERECRPNQTVELAYPVMSLDEIAAFPVPDMAGEHCHLFFWTTQKFLRSAMDVMDKWGFRYVLVMVWHKNGGPQPFGLPQYNCEFVVYARRGTPEFVDTKGFNCCFSGIRREHSRKPDEFYDTIKRVTDGRRIDVFSRGAHDGFDAYGNECDNFANV